MQYLIAGGLLGAAGLVAAAPQAPPNPTTSLAVNANYHLRFCTNKDFKGDCESASAVSSECVDAQRVSGKISSFEASSGQSCYLYAKKDCTGDQSRPVQGSVDNLKSIKFNDKAQSFRCFSSDGNNSAGSASTVSMPVVSSMPEKPDAGQTCLEVQVNRPDQNYPYWSKSFCNHLDNCMIAPESVTGDNITIWSNNAIHCDAFDGPGSCTGAVTEMMNLTPYQKGQINPSHPVNSFKCYEWNNSTVPLNSTATLMQIRPTTTLTLQVAPPTSDPMATVTLQVPVPAATSTALAINNLMNNAPQAMCATLCQDKNLKNQKKGDCEQICGAADQCVDQLPKTISGKVSSVHSDPSMECYLYKEESCKGDRSKPIYGVVQNLKSIGFNDKAKSFQCFEPEKATCSPSTLHEPDTDYCVEACRIDDDSMDCWKSCFSPNVSEQPNCVGELPGQLNGQVNMLDFDSDTLTCHLYTEKHCKGEQSKAVSEDCDLSSLGFENKAKSYRCFKRTDSDKKAVLRNQVIGSASSALETRDVSTPDMNATAAMSKKYCIKIFNEAGFEGNSEQYCEKKGKCKSFPYPMREAILSANASSGSTCYLYEDARCSEDRARSPEIDFHGISDLSQTTDIHNQPVSDFTDMAKAFKCWPDNAGHREESRSIGDVDQPLPVLDQGNPGAGCIELFKKADFAGDKKTFCAKKQNQCLETLAKGWDDAAVSARATDGFACKLFENKQCRGKETNFINDDGIRDLSKIDPKISKKVSSFVCHKAATLADIHAGMTESQYMSVIEELDSAQLWSTTGALPFAVPITRVQAAAAHATATDTAALLAEADQDLMDYLLDGNGPTSHVAARDVQKHKPDCKCSDCTKKSKKHDDDD